MLLAGSNIGPHKPLKSKKNYFTILALAFGITMFICGFSLAYMVVFSEPDNTYSRRFYLQRVELDPINSDVNNSLEDYHLTEDTSVADKMYKKIRILCWILTMPGNHQTKAVHVKQTWGKRCNILLFMSSKEDKSLPTIVLKVKEGRQYLWHKTKLAFQHVYSHYLDMADWFVKADDDTYMILENLRYMLMKSNSSEPVYYGLRSKKYTKQGYMSGGAGYVLSREAVKKFIEVGLKNATGCAANTDVGDEDVQMGKCMEAAKVRAGDSRDHLGRGRFFAFVPEHHLIAGFLPKSFWFWNWTYYESQAGKDCCSDTATSFHYVSPNQMHVLEYLIYHLRPYGIANRVEMPLELEEDQESDIQNNDYYKNNSTELNANLTKRKQGSV